MTRKQFSGIGLLLFCSVLSALSLPAALGLDRRPTAPRPQPSPQPPRPRRLPPCRRTPLPRSTPDRTAKPDRTFEITITSVDADRTAVPAASAVLAGTSNREEQLAGLQAQAKRGVRILQVSDGPILRVSQDSTGTRDSGVTRIRVTAHPHLNAECAEAVDFVVEQAAQGTPWTGIGTQISLAFENGDTRLLSETIRPDGAHHLIYATVFFSPRLVPRPR